MRERSTELGDNAGCRQEQWSPTGVRGRDDEDLAGDVVGGGAGEEDGGAFEVIGIAPASGGDACEDLLAALFRAERRVRDKRRRVAIQKRIMAIDWSWSEPAREYIALYRALCR